MTPEQIMAEFEEREGLPRAALRAAGASREVMVPVFLDYIDRLLGPDIDPLEDGNAFIFVYHLLAEWRETRAYRPMARLLRRDPEFVDALMGDGITECGARVMAGLFDGDPEPICEVSLDRDAEPFVRGQMLDALVIVALERPVLRPAVGDFLRRFHAAAREAPGTDDVVWSSWAFAVAALGLADMAPLVRQVYDDGLIDPMLSRVAEFEESLEETLGTGGCGWFDRRGPITDTVAELSGWYGFSEAYRESRRNRGRVGEADGFVGERPFVQLGKKVGRNDPCPCGSGRKFKKCCLK